MTVKEMRDLCDDHSRGLKDLKDLIDKERGDRDSGDEDLRNQLSELQRDVAPHAKQVPGLHTKLKDLGDLLHPQVKDAKDGLTKHRDATADKHKKLDQDIADLAKRLEAEAAARKAMLDEIEQMQTAFRTKMRGMMTD